MKHAWMSALVLAGLGAGVAPAANTPGSARLTVTMVDPAGNYSRRVDAFWVATGSGAFVQNIRKDAATRQQYLYKWIAARGSYTTIDGYSGATISTWTPVTVTWDCCDTNNVVMPDGQYKFFVEFTDKNGQGPTNVYLFTKGPANFSTNYPNATHFTSASATFTAGSVVHDVTVTRVMPPPIVNPNATYAVPVVVSNKGGAAESFALTLSNLTASTLIATTNIADLANGTARTNNFTWNTGALSPGSHILAAWAAPVSNETATSDNTLSATTMCRVAFHDIAASRVIAPPYIPPGHTSNLTVTVTNLGDFAESNVVMTLRDVTDSLTVAIRSLTSVPAYGGTNLLVAWNTTGRSLGAHTLEATATVVSNDVNAANNTNRIRGVIASGLATNVLLARHSAWRYNDQGLNLHGGPWTSDVYYDGHWESGPGPFGYGAVGLGTTNSYGPDASSKYPCYYFRRTLPVDILPLSLTAYMMRDDGAAVYINGVLACSTNLPVDGSLGYTNLASATVSAPATTNYFAYAVDPALFTIGVNQLAAEVHQVNATSSDVTYDLELVQVVPVVSLAHDAAIAGIEVLNTGIAGDRIRVAVTVTNAGAATESFQVFLGSTNASPAFAAQTNSVTALAPGGSTVLYFDVGTVGLSGGAYGVRAGLVSSLPGESNTNNNILVGSLAVSGSGFELDDVGAAGSIGGFCGAVAISGTRLYAGEGASLTVYDLSSPTIPVRLGSLRLAGFIEGLAATGTTVFAAAGAFGVHVVDAAVPTGMVLQTTFNTSGHAHGLALAGGRLYIADGVGGLRILDVAAPTAPVLLGAYATVGPARAVAVDGSTVYLLDAHEGLLALSTAASASPVLLGRAPGVADGEALSLAGGFAYVVCADGWLRAVNTAGLTVSNSLLLAGSGQGIAMVGSVALVALGRTGLAPAGLEAVDVANPGAMTALSTNVTPGDSAGIALYGTTAYVADGPGGVRIFNVAAPASPLSSGSAGAALRARDSVVTSNYVAYVAAGEGGVGVFNVTDPATPVPLAVYGTAGNAMAIALAGTRLYVADGQYGLRIADVANPAAPVHQATFVFSTSDVPGAIRAVAGDAARVAVTDGRYLGLLDVSNPLVPAWLTRFDAASTNALCFVYDLALSGSNLLAAAGTAGLMVFDAQTLTLRGTLDTVGEATGVDGIPPYALVADGTNGWLVVDLSNPSAPALSATHPESGWVGSIAAAARLVPVAVGPRRVAAYDLLAPLSPVSKASFQPLAQVLRLSAAGPYAYVAEDAAGMAIMDPAAGDHNWNGLPDEYDRAIVDADPNDAIDGIDDVLPEDDFDGDRQTNLQEWIAGTDPTDSDSRFLVERIDRDEGAQGFVVRWQGMAGRTYSILYSTDLTEPSGFQPLATGLPGVNGVNTYTDAVARARCFYIVVVE